MPEHSNQALAEYAKFVATIHDNRIDIEKRITENGGGTYVKRFTMACDVRRYDPDTGMPYIVTGCKFTLVVSYDKKDIETGAVVGGINGHPPIHNQPDPSKRTPPKSLARKLAAYMASRADIKSWRFIDAANIGGPPAARIEYTTDTGTKNVVVAKDEEGVFEIPA